MALGNNVEARTVRVVPPVILLPANLSPRNQERWIGVCLLPGWLRRACALYVALQDERSRRFYEGDG